MITSICRSDIYRKVIPPSWGQNREQSWTSCAGVTSGGRQTSRGSGSGRCVGSDELLDVVQAVQDHCLDKELGRLGCEEWTDSADVVQEEPACLGHRCDVLGEALGDEVTVASPSEMEKSEKGELGRRLAPSYLGWALDGGCPSSSGCPSCRQRFG